MNESEIRAEHIAPALKTSGWGVVKGSRIRLEYVTIGVEELDQAKLTPLLKLIAFISLGRKASDALLSSARIRLY